MRIVIGLLICASIVLCQIPEAPLWNNIFEQDFVETWTQDDNSTAKVVGTYFYNALDNTTRLSRSNGQYDIFCNGLIETNAQCDHIVVDDKRYMYYPETEQCCYCCDSDSGCGILKPNWFVDPDYLGQGEYFGIPVYKWALYEGPNKTEANIYYETIDESPLNRKTVLIARQNYQEDYILDSIRTSFAPITLPAVCQSSSLPSCPGVCAELRPEQAY